MLLATRNNIQGVFGTYRLPSSYEEDEYYTSHPVSIPQPGRYYSSLQHSIVPSFSIINSDDYILKQNYTSSIRQQQDSDVEEESDEREEDLIFHIEL